MPGHSGPLPGAARYQRVIANTALTLHTLTSFGKLNPLEISVELLITALSLLLIGLTYLVYRLVISLEPKP
jgi:uncharacterized membrane protein